MIPGDTELASVSVTASPSEYSPYLSINSTDLLNPLLVFTMVDDAVDSIAVKAGTINITLADRDGG